MIAYPMKGGSLAFVLITMIATAKATNASAAEAPSATAPTFRLAVFDFEADKSAPVESEALTDRITALCSGMPNVTLVDRSELEHVAAEQQISLSGLTDAGAGIKLGRFVAATHLLVGRLTVIGQSNYLIAKVVDVETTEQQVVSVRTRVSDDPAKLFTALDERIAEALAATVHPQKANGSKDMEDTAAWLKDKTVIIDITERHMTRPLVDPASAMTAFNLLKKFGVNAVLPNSPPPGWKDVVRTYGTYQDGKIDFLLEGEGVSSFAAEIQGLTSCRARVELRLVPIPGRDVLCVETGTGAEVDLVEALAAKAALEEATRQAIAGILKAGDKELSGAGQ